MNRDVTLVVAAFNSADMLEKSLKYNLGSGFGQIVVVDGESTDRTRLMVGVLQREYPNRIVFLTRPKKGLADARNAGNDLADSAYIMHAGPDNLIPRDTLESMKKALDKYDLVSCQTRIHHVRGYFDHAHNLYKKRFRQGVRSVVGTPYIARKGLFTEFPFDVGMLNSDDTELCERLTRAGKTIYRCRDICYESGFDDLASMRERWTRWGRGDCLFYEKMKNQWSLPRRILSMMRPLIAELIEPSDVLNFRQYFTVLPFLLYGCGLRYYGWIRHALKIRRHSQ